MAVLPKAIYRFSSISIKIPMTFFKEPEKAVLKFRWKNKRTSIARDILDKKSDTEGIIILDLKLSYRAVVTKEHDISIKTDMKTNVTEY